MKATCLKCLYEWDTKSTMVQVSCPSCGKKVKLKPEIKLEEIKDGQEGISVY